MNKRCARCAETIRNVAYYCSKHDWHLCGRCVKKSFWTNKLTRRKCGQEVHAVNR